MFMAPRWRFVIESAGWRCPVNRWRHRTLHRWHWNRQSNHHTLTHTHTRKQFVYWCGWFNAITATLSRRRFFFIGNSRRMLEPLRQQSLLIFPSRLINTNKIALDLSDLTVLWGGEEGGRREGGGREVGGWSIGNGDISRWLFLIEFHLELIEIDSD